MIELANKRQRIDGVHNSIYADDVTLWTAGGRDGDVQDRLQMAVDAVEEHAKTSAFPAPRINENCRTSPQEEAESPKTPPKCTL